MQIRSLIIGLVVAAMALSPLAGIALANVPGVAINAPPPPPAPNVAVEGGNGLVKVLVTHRDTGIPSNHYVDHVYLYAGDQMLKEWKYTDATMNPDEVFSESLAMPATQSTSLKAVGHCTVHGYSAADVYLTVLPAGTTPVDMVTMNADRAGMQINGFVDTTSASGMINPSDMTMIQQLQSREMTNIRKHQQEGMTFFKSEKGQQFLSQFDVAGKPKGTAITGDMISKAGEVGMPQKIWTDSMGNIVEQKQAREILQMGKIPTGDTGMTGQQGMAPDQQMRAAGQQGMMNKITGTAKPVTEKGTVMPATANGVKMPMNKTTGMGTPATKSKPTVTARPAAQQMR